MSNIIFNWLFILISFLPFGESIHHPIFVSVTEIEHNSKDKTLEMSCKIFTDDFEKTLRSTYKTHVDLLNKQIKPAMDKLVNDYVQKHIKILVDGKITNLKYLGFEKIEEGIYSYYQVDNISSPKKIEVTDNVLVEFNSQQMNLVHVTVGGERKSGNLNGSENKLTVYF